MVDIPNLGEGFLEMWRELLLLAKQAPAPWTLIGAHMVTFVSAAALMQGLGARGMDGGSSFRGNAPNLERTASRHGPFVVEDPRD